MAVVARDELPAVAGTRKAVFRPARAWISVGLLLLLSLLAFLDRQIISLQVDAIKASLGLSDTQLGLLQGLAFALLYAVAGLPLGWAVDRYPRRLILYVSVTVWSLAATATGLARNYSQMFLARTFVGIGEAALAPAALSLISDMFPRDKVATPLGVYAASTLLGAGAALTIGGWMVAIFAGRAFVHFPVLGELASWQAVLVLAGLPGIPMALLAFLINDPAPNRPKFKENESSASRGGFLAYMKTNRRLIAHAYAGFALSSFAFSVVGGWGPTYFMRVHHWSALNTGASFGFLLVLCAPFAPLGGALMDILFRRGHKDAYFLLSGFVTICAAPFLLAAFQVPSSRLALALLGVGLALVTLLASGSYATFQRIAPPMFRGRLMAGFVLCHSILGTGFGPLSVGFMSDHVFHNGMRVGDSVTVVLAIALPAMAAILLTGRSRLRAVP